MKISFFRTHRAKRLLVLPKKYVALPAALLCICALCLLTTLPASVTTAATERQLPIYSVERDGKLCSLTFDAAWGNAVLRRRRINGLRGPLSFFAKMTLSGDARRRKRVYTAAVI